MSEDEAQGEPGVEAQELVEPAPKGVTAQIKEALLGGATEASLKTRFNPTTVRMAAFDLEKQGLRQRDKKPPGGKQNSGTGAEEAQPIATGADGKVAIYAKGSPPEALINAVRVPDGERATFESGMKFGMSLVVLGVRVAQELSAIGIQQASPLIALAKDMRSGEAAAAKSAATEAAAMAAGEVQANIAPLLAHLADSAENRPASVNPMGDMMVRLMEPVMQGVFKQVLPGIPQSDGPSGWARRTE